MKLHRENSHLRKTSINSLKLNLLLFIGLAVIFLSQSGCQVPTGYASVRSPTKQHLKMVKNNEGTIVLFRFHGELNGLTLSGGDASSDIWAMEAFGVQREAYSFKLMPPFWGAQNFSLRIANMDTYSPPLVLSSVSLSESQSHENWIYFPLPEGFYWFKLEIPQSTATSQLPEYYFQASGDADVLYIGTIEFRSKNTFPTDYILRDESDVAQEIVRDEFSKLGLASMKTHLLRPIEEVLTKEGVSSLEPIGMLMDDSEVLFNASDLPMSDSARAWFDPVVWVADTPSEGALLAIPLAVPAALGAVVTDSIEKANLGPCITELNTAIQDIRPNNLFRQSILESLSGTHRIKTLDSATNVSNQNTSEWGSELVANIRHIELCYGKEKKTFTIGLDFLVKLEDLETGRLVYVRAFHCGKWKTDLPYSKYISTSASTIPKSELCSPNGLVLILEEIEKAISSVVEEVSKDLSRNNKDLATVSTANWLQK